MLVVGCLFRLLPGTLSRSSPPWNRCVARLSARPEAGHRTGAAGAATTYCIRHAPARRAQASEIVNTARMASGPGGLLDSVAMRDSRVGRVEPRVGICVGSVLVWRFSMLGEQHWKDPLRGTPGMYGMTVDVHREGCGGIFVESQRRGALRGQVLRCRWSERIGIVVIHKSVIHGAMRVAWADPCVRGSFACWVVECDGGEVKVRDAVVKPFRSLSCGALYVLELSVGVEESNRSALDALGHSVGGEVVKW